MVQTKLKEPFYQQFMEMKVQSHKTTNGEFNLDRESHGRFYIKGKENLLKFYKQIGFSYASEKQEELEFLLRRGKLIN